MRHSAQYSRPVHWCHSDECHELSMFSHRHQFWVSPAVESGWVDGEVVQRGLGISCQPQGINVSVKIYYFPFINESDTSEYEWRDARLSVLNNVYMWQLGNHTKKVLTWVEPVCLGNISAVCEVYIFSDIGDLEILMEKGLELGHFVQQYPILTTLI